MNYNRTTYNWKVSHLKQKKEILILSLSSKHSIVGPVVTYLQIRQKAAATASTHSSRTRARLYWMCLSCRVDRRPGWSTIRPSYRPPEQPTSNISSCTICIGECVCVCVSEWVYIMLARRRGAAHTTQNIVKAVVTTTTRLQFDRATTIRRPTSPPYRQLCESCCNGASINK